MRVRALLIAMVCGVASAAAPVLAATPPSFSFGIHVGPDAPEAPPSDSCLSTQQILDHLRASGYRGFANVDDSGNNLFLDARRVSRWYELEVDNCSGEVLSRTRMPQSSWETPQHTVAN